MRDWGLIDWEGCIVEGIALGFLFTLLGLSFDMILTLWNGKGFLTLKWLWLAFFFTITVYFIMTTAESQLREMSKPRKEIGFIEYEDFYRKLFPRKKPGRKKKNGGMEDGKTKRK